MKTSSFRQLTLLTLLVVLIGALPSAARAGVRPGLEIGANLSSLSYDDLGNFPLPYWDRMSRTSFTGGASLEIPVAKRLALVTGLRYVQQGNRVKFSVDRFPSVAGEFRVVQHYLSIPVLLEYRPLPSRRFFLSVGPEAALLLSGRVIAEYSSPEARTQDSNIKNDLKDGNLSLDAGAGIELPYGRHTGTVSVRYSYGLTGVAKQDHWSSDWKTRGVEGLVGMRW